MNEFKETSIKVLLHFFLIGLAMFYAFPVAMWKWRLTALIITALTGAFIIVLVRYLISLFAYHRSLLETEKSTMISASFSNGEKDALSPKVVEEKPNALYIRDISVHRKASEGKEYRRLRGLNPFIFTHNDGEITMAFVSPHGMMYCLDRGVNVGAPCFPFTYQIIIDAEKWEDMHMEVFYRQPDKKWLEGWKKFFFWEKSGHSQ